MQLFNKLSNYTETVYPPSANIQENKRRTGLFCLRRDDMAPHLPYQRDKKTIRMKTKKASEIFRNLRLLIKEGGYLLSRIALQYHRRK